MESRIHQGTVDPKRKFPKALSKKQATSFLPEAKGHCPGKEGTFPPAKRDPKTAHQPRLQYQAA